MLLYKHNIDMKIYFYQLLIFLAVLNISCESDSDIYVSNNNLDIELWEADSVLLSPDNREYEFSLSNDSVIKVKLENSHLIINPVRGGICNIVIKTGDKSQTINVTVSSSIWRIQDCQFVIDCKDSDISDLIKTDMKKIVLFGSESDENKPNTLGLWTAWAYGTSLKDEYKDIKLMKGGDYFFADSKLFLEFEGERHSFSFLKRGVNSGNQLVVSMTENLTDYFGQKYGENQINKIFVTYEMYKVK